MNENINIFQGDCFDIFPDIEDKSIDLFVLDLPYANDIFGKCTACKWDDKIDLDKMWIEIKRMMKPNANIIFFCNIKLGFALINSNMKWFRYELIWKKSRKVGFLSANKKPLVQHEYIYVFGDNGKEYNMENEEKKYNNNIDLVNYSKKILQYINKTKKEIIKECGTGVDHFFRYSRGNFSLPLEENYNKLIEYYKINEMNDFIEYNELKEKWEKNENIKTYNPQKTEGKPYKNGAILNDKNVYGTIREKGKITKTDRHPSTILEFNNPKKSLHTTQKPTDLLEWIIKSYSNENDLVMDFTMGSGSTGEACKNTNRRFIGIEKDEHIFKIAQNRLI